MKINKFLIAGGNSTVLIFGKKNKKLSKKYLKEVEQVGFVSNNKLQMMGGEFCVNATLALAHQLRKEGYLYTSGISNKIIYKNSKNKTKIKIPLNYKKNNNLVLFRGIGYICIKKKPLKNSIIKLANKYNLPAFGAIVYNKNKITPYIYVKQVNSFVKETACGSGSIAYSIFSGFNKIIQPTGEIINIKLGKLIEVSAKVTLINKENLGEI